jgi:hypothetical protein
VRQAERAADSDQTGRRALPLPAESQRSAEPEEPATAVPLGLPGAPQLAAEPEPEPEVEAEPEEAALALPPAAQ